mmetsp:Transcript_12787/g.28106  ORF Transcript_12787/g.28106 Transcript_12787/m.28106 type:complete len:536 (+) Transcript_12787:65-1672(+)
MGKKSRRQRSSNPTSDETVRPAPALRPAAAAGEEETVDNLLFEDPYVEEVEEEHMVAAEEEEEDDDDGGGEWEDDDNGNHNDKNQDADYELIQSWNPFSSDLPDSVKLEIDPAAYKMHHGLTAEWPSLSFDFIRDQMGEHRTRFPHSLITALGSQADEPHNNQLTVMKLSDLARMEKAETEDDILGEAYDHQKKGNEDSDDDDDESDEEVDLDPIVEHYSIPHYGGVNRVRCLPQQPHIVATWSDQGQVNLFNTEPILQRFDASAGNHHNRPSQSAPGDIPTKPFFSYSQHSTEGYSLDWSNTQQGQLLTGDCDGNIHVWKPNDSGAAGYTVTPSYQPNDKITGSHAMRSIEDLQWSPTESTVFASAECGGYIRVFDIRAPHRSMLNIKVHANGSDVNVLSWNALVTNLLASGSDDGVLSVWDLRQFSGSAPAPLARFTPHQTPITSVEWHPTDESMVALTDARGAYIYDLSVEEDDVQQAANQNKNNDPQLPPQLLFVHSGSEQFKEVHWHPQISSCLMTTALSGYSVFIPSNL